MRMWPRTQSSCRGGFIFSLQSYHDSSSVSDWEARSVTVTVGFDGVYDDSMSTIDDGTGNQVTIGSLSGASNTWCIGDTVNDVEVWRNVSDATDIKQRCLP